MKKTYNVLSVIILAATAILLASCYSANDSGSSNESGGYTDGTGGSMARFTIAGDYMYTVDDYSLKITLIKDPARPQHVNTYHISNFNGDIETIFPYDGKLFIGSRSAMHIYDITGDPTTPKKLSTASHFTSCDPVVAYGDYAYVTLSNSNRTCNRGRNELLVYDITDLNDPVLGKVFDYGALQPAGLGVDGPAGRLFVCTDKGVKVYSLEEDPAVPVWIDDISHAKGMGTFNAYDVIPRNGLLMVIGPDGLFQFDYTGEEIIPLSSFDLRVK